MIAKVREKATGEYWHHIYSSVGHAKAGVTHAWMRNGGYLPFGHQYHVTREAYKARYEVVELEVVETPVKVHQL